MLKTKNFKSITKKTRKFGITIKGWFIIIIPTFIIYIFISILYSLFFAIIFYLTILIIEYIDDDAIDIFLNNLDIKVGKKLYV